ncbi:MAG: SpoIIE family protein phosphatase [Pyrinomonadaceae bacterium MAG19_C2-C3]|nr:SpoIIE family protein phosphatase [Pyrinomonadaceae bacterium MAG19_C2-C3]
MNTATRFLETLPTDVRLIRMEALVHAGIALNRAANLDEILLEILNHISTQLECDRATAFLLDERTGQLHARQMAGSEFIEIVMDATRGVVGQVVTTGESMIIDDAHASPYFDDSVDRRTGYHTHTILCVPLLNADGKILGAVQAINRHQGFFSNEELVYLEAFGVLAALAVEREQLMQDAVRSHLLSTELQLARGIQSRLLPNAGNIPLPAPFVAWGISQACYDVGGDMYDAVMLADGECAFWVADVSGKGIGAALLMTTLQTELRALVHTEPDLTKLAAELNRRVQIAAPIGTYATLFVGRLSATNEQLRYVNGGHQPPLWVAGSDTHAPASLQTGGFPVGLLPGASYEEGRVGFTRGTRLAVFSDGMTDAQNCAGETYEEAGIIASLNHLPPRDDRAPNVEHIGAQLLSDLDRFRIGAPPQDDTTLFVIGLD